MKFQNHFEDYNWIEDRDFFEIVYIISIPIKKMKQMKFRKNQNSKLLES